MKALLVAVMAISPLLANAAEKPMTMTCEIRYNLWNSLSDPYGPDEQLPVNVKLEHEKRESHVDRYTAKVVQTTKDGRYQITADAFQPAKGDLLRYKMVRVSVLDTTTNVSVEAAYPAILAGKKDILQSTQLITWNLDANKPNQPGSQLHIDCRLVK